MMNFDRRTLSVVGSLLLVLLASQSHLFDVLFDTLLGRIVLIVSIFIISFVNRILGMVAVLFFIVALNTSGMHLAMPWTEGFESNPVKPTLTDEQKQQLLTTLQTNAKAKADAAAASKAAAEAAAATAKTDAAAADAAAATETTTATAAEGFDIIGAENSIKRGKQSNSIPISTSGKKNWDHVMPYGSFADSFSELFSAF